jgi:hypothetical protein
LNIVLELTVTLGIVRNKCPFEHDPKEVDFAEIEAPQIPQSSGDASGSEDVKES